MEPTIPDGAKMLWFHMTGNATENEYIKKEHLIRRNQVIVFEDHRKFEGEYKSYLIKRITGLPGDIRYDRWGHQRIIQNGYVWVTGDNPTNSFDSRYFGPISENRIAPFMLLFVESKFNRALLDYLPDIPIINTLNDFIFDPADSISKTFQNINTAIRNRIDYNFERMKDL